LESLVTPHIQLQCEALSQVLLAKQVSMTCAESCTGGMIAASCTNLSGSSAWFDRGFVTYSNEAKTDMLDVPATLIAKHGAVSEEVAKAMALGALLHSKADFSVAVTGIAGPTGGSEDKPVGTVWFAWASTHPAQCVSLMKVFPGDRQAVREATTALALANLVKMVAAS
jgi:nicotinamide-nucleotide amidase